MGLDARTHSNLVSVLYPRLHQRPGMAGTQDGAGWIALRSAGQLFPLGGGSAASTAPAESTIGGELVGTAAADCRAPQPAAMGRSFGISRRSIIRALSNANGPPMYCCSRALWNGWSR